MNKKSILITGGAGFIGSHLVRLFVKKYPNYTIINLDALTYSGNLANLIDIEKYPNYTFVRADIGDANELNKVFLKHNISDIIHLAAESHVDRSIKDPISFVRTNVMGTLNLLEAAKRKWTEKKQPYKFYHVSTDEVYGSLADTGFFKETTPYDPRSPYSASKASSDHLVRAYFHTYKLPVLLSNCSNNYGANQFPEKLIPLFINNIKNKKDLPVYGKGDNIRDWLWVEDHVRAIDVVFHEGTIGQTYNIGGNNEYTNISLIKLLCNIMDSKLNRNSGDSYKLVKFIEDRAGHDKRYAIDASKIRQELGWEPSIKFKEGLEKTVDWYLENTKWLENVTSGEYQTYYKKQYESN